MGNVSLQKLKEIDGFIAADLIDTTTGMCMAAEGAGSVDIELDAAVSTDVYNSIVKAIDVLKLNDKVDDVLISLGETYQLLRPLRVDHSLVLHIALDRSKSNLALARRALSDFESSFDFSAL